MCHSMQAAKNISKTVKIDHAPVVNLDFCKTEHSSIHTGTTLKNPWQQREERQMFEFGKGNKVESVKNTGWVLL